VLGELKNLINQTYEHRDRIQPSDRSRRILTVLEIYKLLPRKNCGECGEPACMGFAVKVLADSQEIRACKLLFTGEYAISREKLLQMLDLAGVRDSGNIGYGTFTSCEGVFPLKDSQIHL